MLTVQYEDTLEPLWSLLLSYGYNVCNIVTKGITAEMKQSDTNSGGITIISEQMI